MSNSKEDALELKLNIYHVAYFSLFYNILEKYQRGVKGVVRVGGKRGGAFGNTGIFIFLHVIAPGGRNRKSKTNILNKTK